MGIVLDELKNDLEIALKDLDRQLPEKRLAILMDIFTKHLEISRQDLIMSGDDYDSIRAIAHTMYLDTAFPKYIGNNRHTVPADEARFLVIIEATIRFLTTHDCFNKTPKFDYKDRK